MADEARTVRKYLDVNSGIVEQKSAIVEDGGPWFNFRKIFSTKLN